MSKNDDPVKGELVDPGRAEADEKTEALIVSWDDEDWEIPPSFDQLDIDAVEAFAELAAASAEGDTSVASFRHVTSFLKSLLGPRQWHRLKKDRTPSDLNGFIDAVMARYGERNRGE